MKLEVGKFYILKGWSDKMLYVGFNKKHMFYAYDNDKPGDGPSSIICTNPDMVEEWQEPERMTKEQRSEIVQRHKIENLECRVRKLERLLDNIDIKAQQQIDELKVEVEKIKSFLVIDLSINNKFRIS